MDGGDWIALTGVILTGSFSVWSAISAAQAKTAEAAASARAEEALKAERAAVAAQRDIVEELKRASDLREAESQREDQALAAIEADPLELQPIPDDPDIRLVNRSPTPKYGVHVSGFKVLGDVLFNVIGPGKSKEVSINRIMSDDDDVVLTWHQLSDRSDTPLSTTEVVPSRIERKPR